MRFFNPDTSIPPSFLQNLSLSTLLREKGDALGLYPPFQTLPTPPFGFPYILLLGIFLSRFFLTKNQLVCGFCYPTFVIQYSLLLLKGYMFLPTFIKSASDNCSLFLLSHSIKGPLPYYKHNTVLSCQRAKARKPLIYLLPISNHHNNYKHVNVM